MGRAVDYGRAQGAVRKTDGSGLPFRRGLDSAPISPPADLLFVVPKSSSLVLTRLFRFDSLFDLDGHHDITDVELCCFLMPDLIDERA